MIKPGDDVFAKVKGHSPWPATVLEQQTKNKYKVFFYGTYELGFVKDDQIWYFEEKVEEFAAKYAKKKDYAKALEEIREKKDGKYHPGEKIFAKVKRQVPWPAKVIAVTSLEDFHVILYGGKSAHLEEVELANMWKWKEKAEEFGAKYGKKTGYVEAVNLMEDDKDISSVNEVIIDEDDKVSVQMEVDAVDSEPKNEIVSKIANNLEDSSVDASKPSNDNNGNNLMVGDCCEDHAQPAINQENDLISDDMVHHNDVLQPVHPSIVVEAASSEDPPTNHHNQEPMYLRPTLSSLSKQVSPSTCTKPFQTKPPWNSGCKTPRQSLSPSPSRSFSSLSPSPSRSFSSLSPSPTPRRSPSPSPSPNPTPCRNISFHLNKTLPPNRVATAIKRIKVSVRDRSFLIPIKGEHLSVLWLSAEAAKRYSKVEGREPVLILTTKDKSELDPQDLLCDLFDSDDVELASQITRWKM